METKQFESMMSEIRERNDKTMQVLEAVDFRLKKFAEYVAQMKAKQETK